MSFPALSWAVRQKLPSTQKLVLLMLAERHNKDSGQCNPSLELLADDCGLSRRSVIDQIAKLQEAGYLTVRHRSKDNVKLPSQYVLHLGFGVPEKVQTEAADPYLLPAKVVNELHQGSERAAHKPGIEPGTIEPVICAAARATVLPSDFVPNETCQQMARDFGLNLAEQQAAFKDHHTAKGTTFKDWQAAFRTWLRNANRFGKPSAMTPNNRSTQKYASASATIFDGVFV